MRGTAVTVLTMLLAHLLAGCASPPAAQVASSVPGAEPAPVREAPAGQAVAKPGAEPAAYSKPSVPPGYHVRVRRGETLCCETDSRTGTRFARESCWTPEALERYLETRKSEADAFMHTSGVCNPTECKSN